MTDIIKFGSELLRYIVVNNRIWFYSRDVCAILCVKMSKYEKIVDKFLKDDCNEQTGTLVSIYKCSFGYLANELRVSARNDEKSDVYLNEYGVIKLTTLLALKTKYKKYKKKYNVFESFIIDLCASIRSEKTHRISKNTTTANSPPPYEDRSRSRRQTENSA